MDFTGKRKGKPSLDYNWREINKVIWTLLDKFLKQGFRPTLRELHYALVSLKAFPNLQKSYGSLSRHMTKKREEGYFPMNCIVDERHPIVEINDVYYSPEAHIFNYVDKLRNFSEWYHEEDKQFPRWFDQSNYVELWTEKQAMVKHLKQIVEEKNLQVRIASFGGFPGTSELNDHVEERIKKKMKSGKNVYILWFGDFDPSGNSINQSTFDRLSYDSPWGLEQYQSECNVEFKLLRVAVTKEQIHDYDLPWDIDRLSEEEQEKLQRDSRYREFERKHGKYACEVDSLPVINLEAFNNIVIQSVNQYFNNDIYQKGLDEHKKTYAQEYIDDNVDDYLRLLLEEFKIRFMWRWLEF